MARDRMLKTKKTRFTKIKKAYTPKVLTYDKFNIPKKTPEYLRTRVADIPEDIDDVEIGPCYEKDRDELVFTSRNENQCEENIQDFLRACPQMDLERAILFLDEFCLQEAIRIAKKLCPPVSIPSWARPFHQKPKVLQRQYEEKQVKRKIGRPRKSRLVDEKKSQPASVSRKRRSTGASSEAENVPTRSNDEQPSIKKQRNFSETKEDPRGSMNHDKAEHLQQKPKKKVGRPRKTNDAMDSMI